MGSRLSDRHAAAICTFATRCSDHLAANTAAALTSSYSETGPRPGASVPDDDRAQMVPVVSGGLGEDIELVTLTAGSPILDASNTVATLGYRLAGEADTQVRGWISPSWLAGWQAINWSDTVTYGAPRCCTLPGSQRVLIAYHDNTNNDIVVKRWDPADHSLDDLSILDAIPNGVSPGTMVPLVLPSGRVLLIGWGNTVYSSDDEGTTWSVYSRGLFDDFTEGAHPISAAVNPAGQILMVIVDTAFGDVFQLVSDDLLASCESVVTASALAATGAASTVHCAALPSGGFVVAYLRASDSFPCVRILPSAGSSLSDATEVQVVAGVARNRVALAADPDGLLWLLTDAGPTAPHQVVVYVSTDGGTTWNVCDVGPLAVASSNVDYLTNWSACSAAGHLLLCHQWVASTGNEDGSVGMCILGGWSTLTNGPVASGYGNGLRGRSGTGIGSGVTSGRSWIPIELPGDGAYTAAGAGTDTLASPGELTISTAAAIRSYTRTTGTQLQHAAMWQVRVTSGGALTTNDVAVHLTGGDTVVGYAMYIRMTTTGFRVFDPNLGAALATATVDMTTNIIIAAQLISDQGTSGVWYRRPGDTKWTVVWTGALTVDGTPAATGDIVWGHISSGTAESAWRFMGEAEGGSFGHSLGWDPSAVAGFPTSNLATGRPVTHLPIPLPMDAGDGTDVPWLSAAAGPATVGEVYSVDADHDYPVEATMPWLSPSPAEKWRSTDKTEQILAFDFTKPTYLGNSVALVAIGCNFRTAVLEYSAGGAWTTAGTMGLWYGFASGLTYNLSGDTLIPGTSTGDGIRFIQENELAGGYVTIEVAGVAAARRVLSNTAGAWTASATATVRPRLILEGCDGTEDTTGDCTLQWPSGVFVLHNAAVFTRRYWRIRIPASQETPDDYYEAGVLALANVRTLGRAPDWGWSREHQPNSETTRSRRGTTRVKELGPPISTWSLAWTDGNDLQSLRTTLNQDWVGSSNAAANTAREDIGWLLRGIQEETRSWADPVVYLAEVPDDPDVTITDRTMWHFGRGASSIREENSHGTEGASENNRIAQLVIEGIP